MGEEPRGRLNFGILSDTELVADSGCGVGAMDIPHRGRDSPGESPEVSQPNTSLSLQDQGGSPEVFTSLSLQDRRKQQLRLINEKLAKRHSTLQRKELPSRSVKLSAQFESPELVSAVREDSEVALAPNVAVKSSSVVRKTTLMQPTLSREAPGKSVAYRPTLYSDTSHPVSAEQSSISTEAFTMVDPLPTSMHPAGDLLDSESSFLPVSLLQDTTYQDQSGHEDSSLDHLEADTYISSLLSSLNSAYGYSSLTEKSRLLSTLVGSERLHLPDTSPLPEQLDFHREAVKIQAAYRGHLARREYKRLLKELKAALLIQARWYVPVHSCILSDTKCHMSKLITNITLVTFCCALNGIIPLKTCPDISVWIWICSTALLIWNYF